MVRKAINNDVKILAEFACQLFGDSLEVQENEMREFLKNDNTQLFICFDGDTPAGFAQCGLRHDYVEGTSSSPVGYLEGIFIKTEFRRKGFADELLSACEAWAKSIGCTEFASDCEIDNETSIAFHKSMHFKEANRIVCFTKNL